MIKVHVYSNFKDKDPIDLYISKSQVVEIMPHPDLEDNPNELAFILRLGGSHEWSITKETRDTIEDYLFSWWKK